VKVAQKVGAKAGELRSWLRQLSELQRGFGVGVGDGLVEVEDFVLEVEVEVVVEEDDDEMGVCETQRSCPIERSQFASKVGFQAYSWADVIPKLVSIK
jgi:transposase-like protein